MQLVTHTHVQMKTLSIGEAGLKQYQALHSSHMFAFHSDVNEGLEHEVTNGHITNKSGRSMHKLQAHRKSEVGAAFFGKFMHVCSQTLGKYVSFLASGRDKLH